MSAEFYVTFQPEDWYRINCQSVIQIAQQLQSYQFLQSNIRGCGLFINDLRCRLKLSRQGMK
ncbi:hypothetical protein EYY58_05365 [Acinetobacter bereziniae]|nr:hypothetical protein EYB59_05735 [Acinetobacter bereziniae]TNL62077.1 hypothetical protein EYY58_05365 [Acinetobacter bereziniae]